MFADIRTYEFNFCRSEKCSGYVLKKDQSTPGKQSIFCEECLNFRKITRLNSRRVDLATKVKRINKQCRKKSKARKKKEKRLVKNVQNQYNISNKSEECIQ